MFSGLKLFLDRLPDWLVIVDETDLPASVIVRSDNIGLAIGQVDLLLKTALQEPCVEELESKTKQLPEFCFERHIMPDRSFCLGHIEGDQKLDNIDAFWCKLWAFLKNQDYATRHGVWPIEQGMSHSETSMKAQKLIESMICSDEDLLQDWLLSAFRGKGWISEVAHRGLDKPELTLTKRQACKNAELISNILTLEQIRFSSDRLLHEAIIQSPQESIVCCGSMKTCPMNVRA